MYVSVLSSLHLYLYKQSRTTVATTANTGVKWNQIAIAALAVGVLSAGIGYLYKVIRWCGHMFIYTNIL